MCSKLCLVLVLCRIRAKTRQQNTNQQTTELVLSEIGQIITSKPEKKEINITCNTFQPCTTLMKMTVMAKYGAFKGPVTTALTIYIAAMSKSSLKMRQTLSYF